MQAKELRVCVYSTMQEWLEKPGHTYVGQAIPQVPGATRSKWAPRGGIPGEPGIAPG